MKLRITNTDKALTFYGHGKLLLSAEYFVLDGARALAVPTKFGQQLRVKKLHSSEKTLYWVALDINNKPWLQLTFDTDTFSCFNSESDEAKSLSKILNEARKLNPDFLKEEADLAVETKLEFPRNWGLGSSSTLIYCIAQWANVDGYTLLKNSIGGSGYDVACAASTLPILYRLSNNQPESFSINWTPPFKQHIFFAYTGKKQLSSEGIKFYRTQLTNKTHGVSELTRITEAILKCDSLNKFEELIQEHEEIVGSSLKMMKVKDTLFADYWGSVKSLGAWGGDFVLLTNETSREELSLYLHAKNIATFFSWDELILQP
jgi:mevalonate kinase